MDRPTPLREYVIRKAAAGQSLEAGLFEIVEMDRVIDMTEGVQLVGAGFDNSFGDAQFLPPSGGERRGPRSLLVPHGGDRVDDPRNGAVCVPERGRDHLDRQNLAVLIE